MSYSRNTLHAGVSSGELCPLLDSSSEGATVNVVCPRMLISGWCGLSLDMVYI